MQKNILLYLSASLLALFGLVTLFMSSSVLFDWLGIRAKQGHYVPFVVWANGLCALLYLSSAYQMIPTQNGMLKAFHTLRLAFIVLLLAGGVFLIHIYSGGMYETKTIYALLFRMGVTLFFIGVVYFSLKSKN